MSLFQPGWLPLALGSVPYIEPNKAWECVLKRFSHIPVWPQLPRRVYLESMYAQFSERFPGLVIEEERIYVDRRRDLDPDLERLYLAYLENDLQYGQTSPKYAAGLGALLSGQVSMPHPAMALKGQITGPVSWGLTVVDQNQRPILYDEILADAVGKHLRLKAAWQERELSKLAPRTIMFLDEPYMASFGSAFVSLSREITIGMLEEVLAGMKGIKGVHCCGNTDWSILLSTGVDIVSLDAYDYGDTLALYPEDVSRFLARGGTLAWGIVPVGGMAESETASSLVERLLATMERLVEKGVPREPLFQRGLVSPSCGAGSISPTLTERIFDLTVAVSAEMRHRYIESNAVAAPQLPSRSSA
jgi:hypothetical protein